MNFRKGKNIILFDGRLKAGGPTDPPCKPPVAWKVIQTRYLKLQQIIDGVKTALDSVKLEKADGLYIFCHGKPAFLQLGIENVTNGNIKIFKDIIDRKE